MTWAYLGPIGNLLAVPNPAEGVQVETSRASSELVSVGGVRYVQRAPRAPRSWSIQMLPWRDESAVAYLAACAQGVVPGPLYMLTSDAARGNLLPDHLAAPGMVMGSLGGDGTVAVNVTIAGGLMVRTLGVRQSATRPWSPVVAIRAEVDVMLSVWADRSGPAVEWRTVTSAGVQVSTGTLATASVSGHRGQVLVPVAENASGFQVRLIPGSGAVGGLRLTEGPHDPVWVAGMGVPQVAIDDPGRVLRLATATETLSDYTVTVREVGE